METRITYAEYEVLRMEHLLRKWVRKLSEYPRIGPEEWKALEEVGYTIPVPGQFENEKWGWDALEMLSEQTQELLSLGAQRREGLPQELPSNFLLVRQPVTYGKTLAEVVIPKEMNAPPTRHVYDGEPMGEGKTPQYAKWPYYEPYCHPVRHIRAFGYGSGYMSRGLFALIAPDYQRYQAAGNGYMATFALCYDWIAPIKWHVNLCDYEVGVGPYTGRSAFEHVAQVSCLHYCHNSGRLIERGKVVDTHITVEWAMHLVPPYAITTDRPPKKKRRR